MIDGIFKNVKIKGVMKSALLSFKKLNSSIKFNTKTKEANINEVFKKMLMNFFIRYNL